MIMPAEEKNENDVELAVRAQAGSMEAFEQLVFRYEKRILSFLRQRTATLEDAEDLAQQTFVTAYRKLSYYKSSYPPAVWLFTLARRQAIDFYRKKQKPAFERPEEWDVNDPARILSQEEGHKSLWAWVKAELPESQFTALWLRFQEELSIKEIAQVMGRTQILVKVLLHRGRKKLIRARAADSNLSHTNPFHNASPADDSTRSRMKSYAMSH
jgi:RNA polymerase sigma-70 factor, ECF subfamily